MHAFLNKDIHLVAWNLDPDGMWANVVDDRLSEFTAFRIQTSSQERCAVGHAFIGVHRLEDLVLVEVLFEPFFDSWHTGGASHKNDLIDIHSSKFCQVADLGKFYLAVEETNALVQAGEKAIYDLLSCTSN